MPSKSIEVITMVVLVGKECRLTIDKLPEQNRGSTVLMITNKVRKA